MSRATFNGLCADVAWQKQLRDKYLAEGVPPVPHLDLKRAEVRLVSRHLAEQVILKYEWLGDLPGCRWFYGIFFGSYCAGVACVGALGAGVHTYKALGLSSQAELAYLCRGACVHWAPLGTNSKLVSWACRLLAKEQGPYAIVAYADSDAGEIGTIYQACGWVYYGLSESPSEWLSPVGRIYNQNYPQSLARSRGGSFGDWAKRLKAGGWKEQKSNPKHRYARALRPHPALEAALSRMKLPYPKRVLSVVSDTPDNQTGEGGAKPTKTLLFRSQSSRSLGVETEKTEG